MIEDKNDDMLEELEAVQISGVKTNKDDYFSTENTTQDRNSLIGIERGISKLKLSENLSLKGDEQMPIEPQKKDEPQKP